MEQKITLSLLFIKLHLGVLYYGMVPFSSVIYLFIIGLQRTENNYLLGQA